MYNNIPEELKSNNSWIRYTLIDQGRKKHSKIPYCVNQLYWAKVNDSKTWGSYNTVIENMNNKYNLPVWMKTNNGKWDFKNHDFIKYENKKFDGIGYVFSNDCLYLGIDYDNWYDKDGNINKKSMEILSLCGGSYTELSQSGKGGHTILKLNSIEEKNKLSQELIKRYSNPTGVRNDDIGIELYFTGRYFVMTGNVINGFNKIKTVNVDTILNLFQGIRKEEKKINHTSNNNNISYFDNNKIIDLVSKASNGNQFLHLYNQTGTDGNSEGDLAICGMLAFYTQNVDQIKNILLNSPRYRQKFINHPNYLDNTIKKAISGLKNTYNPNYNNNNIKNNNYQQDVDKPVDIFEKINNYLSDKKNDSEDIQLSDSCFLDDNYQHGYYMVKQGFCKRYINKDFYYDKVIIPTKVYPTKIYIVNGFEEIEYNEKVLCENETFSTVSKFKTWLKKFSKTIWFDGDGKDLVYFEKYISIYRKFSNLQPIKSTEKLGWFEDTFTPYNNINIFTKNDTPEILNLINSLNCEGSYKTWKEYINKYSENDTFRIYLNAGLSAPLVSFLKRPSFWVHNFAKHSAGKTPALYAAASIFSNPAKYAPSFNTTRVGLEFKLHMLGNMPCMFDDSQNLNDWSKKNIASLVYDVANGHGKTRGTLKGDMQESKFWYTTMITNGEQELLSGNEFEGAVKRLMEFDTIPFDNHIEARQARKIFMNNYGFAGKIFINILIKYKKEVNLLLEKIENIIDNNINFPTHIQNIASMCACDYILNHYILGIEQKKSFDKSIEWAKRILKLLPLESEVNKINIGLSKINEFILSNTHKFRPECPQGRVGFFKNGEVYFFPEELKKLLLEWDIPEKRFMKEIKQLDCTITDNKGNFKQTKYLNRNIRAVGFNNIDIESLIPNISEYY